MIAKYYRLYCDKCDRWIDDIETSSIDRAMRIEKQNGNGTKITKRVNGAYHIECADCAKENK